jgi:hypothetical protein
MYGVADCGVFASPWLLGSDKLIETKRVMLPVSARWVEEKNIQYPLLLNHVHADNTVSIKWLKSLGFQFINLIKEFGVGKEPFYQFVRIKENVYTSNPYDDDKHGFISGTSTASAPSPES